MFGPIFWVALGGSLGATSRYLISTVLFVPGQFPWATLVINIAGSFGIGLLWGFGYQQAWFEQWGRYLLVVGLLGGFTTFSAFSLETVGLVEGGRFAGAFSYVLASLVGCVLAAWAGQRLTGS
ncbi:MAG: fluoride efflux transporter CrcB [Pseudomonadales bacterium]|jgi:CrcB protein